MINETTKGKTVLVIEDEQPLLNVIKTKLEKNSFVVTTARTILQALNYLKKAGSVDAIWLDHYLLGKEDGLDFVTELKSHEGQWKKIPIFVISNTASPDNIKSYIRLGISKYFVKNEYQLDNIVAEIKSFLENLKE
jgi:CheY-like chemotaxis protein